MGLLPKEKKIVAPYSRKKINYILPTLPPLFSKLHIRLMNTIVQIGKIKIAPKKPYPPSQCFTITILSTLLLLSSVSSQDFLYIGFVKATIKKAKNISSRGTAK